MILLSCHQPGYLSGIMLFNKISLSDHFMFMSDAQFSHQNWFNRNKIRMGNNFIYLTVPVSSSGKFGQKICETNYSGIKWKAKHLKTLIQTYSKCTFFNDYFSILEDIIMREWNNLADMNIKLTSEIATILGLKTEFHDVREYSIDGKKTEALISMCKVIGADSYISNLGASNYIDLNLMQENNITHYWQLYDTPKYKQQGKFIENLSIIDLLFNCGSEEASHIVKNSGMKSDNI